MAVLKRPSSVTAVAWVVIAQGCLSLLLGGSLYLVAGGPPDARPTWATQLYFLALIGVPLGPVTGIALLRRQNWARYIYPIWNVLPLLVGIGFAISAEESLADHLLFCLPPAIVAACLTVPLFVGKAGECFHDDKSVGEVKPPTQQSQSIAARQSPGLSADGSAAPPPGQPRILPRWIKVADALCVAFFALCLVLLIVSAPGLAEVLSMLQRGDADASGVGFFALFVVAVSVPILGVEVVLAGLAASLSPVFRALSLLPGIAGLLAGAVIFVLNLSLGK